MNPSSTYCASASCRLGFFLFLVSLMFLIGFGYSSSSSNVIPPNTPRHSRHPDILSLHNLKHFSGLTKPGRNHALLVFFTASDAGNQKCPSCVTFFDHLIDVMKMWKQSEHSTASYPLYFAVVDASDSHDVFKKLQLDSVPKIRFYHPTKGPHYFRNAVPSSGFSEFTNFRAGADALTTWLSTQTRRDVQFKKPIDSSRILLYVFYAVAAATILAFSFPYILWFFRFKFLWSCYVLGFLLIVNGGYMWTRIRGPPFAARSKLNQISYVSGGVHQQYEAEVYITAILNGICALSFIALATLVPSMKPGSHAQSVAGMACVVFAVFSFSMLAFVFSMKSEYPFRMLL